jgi:hypothetical protein
VEGLAVEERTVVLRRPRRDGLRPVHVVGVGSYPAHRRVEPPVVLWSAEPADVERALSISAEIPPRQHSRAQHRAVEGPPQRFVVPEREQRKLLGTILQPTLDRIYNSVSQICGDNCAVIDFLQNLNMPIPNDMLRIMSYKANVELKRMFSDGMNVAALETLIDEVGRWSLKIEAADISLKASAWINGMMEKIERHPDGIALMDAIAKTVGLLGRISVPLNLWKTQNIYFMLDQNIHHRSPAGPLSDFGSRSEDWISAFHRLGEQLRIRELP